MRDYQEECIKTCLDAFMNKGITKQAVSLPVGSGKTVIFSHLIARLPPIDLTAKKALVLAHREELLDQAARTIKSVDPNLKVMIEQGTSHADVQESDVVIASVPTLGRSNSTRLTRFNPKDFKCIIIDEAHHAPADSYRRVLDYFTVRNPDILIWGCSATFSRQDHLGLGSVFEKIVFHVDICDLMARGYLCPVRAFQVDTDVDLKSVPIRNGDFDDKQLSLAIDTPARNEKIVQTWARMACEHQRQSTIVFGSSVRHVENLAHCFATVARPAVITGDTRDAVRRDILDLYRSGEVNVLLNCAVLTEGTDLPRTDSVLLTRPTCNQNLYIQMVGRGLRRYEGKEYLLLLDVVDRTTPDRSLVTFPTLLPKHNLSIKTENMDQEVENKRRKREYTDLITEKLRITLTLNDAIFAMGGHRIAWIPVEPGKYIASDGKSMLIILQVANDLKTGQVMVEDSKSKHNNLTIAHTGTPLHEALESVSAYLSNLNKISRFLKDAHWRLHPITGNQLRYIHHIANRTGASDGQFREIYKWTVGKASDVITKFKYTVNSNMNDQQLSWEDLVHGCGGVCLVTRRRAKRCA